MKVLDVNVLVYAFRSDVAQHRETRQWLERLLHSNRPFGVPDIVFAGFVRTVTRKPFNPPSDPDEAWGFVKALRSLPQCAVLYGSAQHFDAFSEFAQKLQLTGNLLTDAYLAAHAVISDGEVVSCDDDFRRFPGLTWRSPLDDQLRTNPR